MKTNDIIINDTGSTTLSDILLDSNTFFNDSEISKLNEFQVKLDDISQIINSLNEDA